MASVLLMEGPKQVEEVLSQVTQYQQSLFEKKKKSHRILILFRPDLAHVQMYNFHCTTLDIFFPKHSWCHLHHYRLINLTVLVLPPPYVSHSVSISTQYLAKSCFFVRILVSRQCRETRLQGTSTFPPAIVKVSNGLQQNLVLAFTIYKSYGPIWTLKLQ